MFDERDAYCPLAKQYAMLRVVRAAHDAMEAVAARGVPVDALDEAAAIREVARMRSWPEAQADERASRLIEQIRSELGAL